MILKLCDLNKMPGLWECFLSSFLVSENVIRPGNEVCLPYVEQSINPVFTIKMVASYEEKKQEQTK